jgi:CHAD domain-containing protein
MRQLPFGGWFCRIAAPFSRGSPAMPLPAATRLSIEELCARFEVETAHAYHVAALALKLFDATHGFCGVPAEDRIPLEAACLLHDIGFARDPRRHAEVGASLVRREKIAGLDSAQQGRVASLIRLHAAGLPLERARLSVRRAAERPRTLYLAALLRMADALDSCHLQDAVIASVRPTKRHIRVGVRCAHCPANVDAARRQAGLWREALPVGLDFRLLQGGPRPALVGPAVPLPEAIRRLLFLNFRMMVTNVEGALAANSDEALHDMRIAIRRMRTVLRAFRGALAGTSAERIGADLQQLNRTLGIARDLDVWIGFFSGESVSSQFTGHRLWAGFVSHQLELRRLQQTTVRRQLHGARFNALRARITRFLRVELPRLAAAGPEVAITGPARQAVRKSLRRAMELGHLRRSLSPEKLHRLRIALRRVRYLGGFFGPALGRPVRKLARRTHALERVLGEMRDADLALARIRQEGPTPPRLLMRQLDRLRQADSATVANAWGRLEEPAFLLGLHRLLKQ